ncbi:MAG: hypothetical protein JWN62_1999 [Acidimicrobiales bacterium]|jgi:gas vesicle protein|nr:hypothetical protein [Acidimicrobiales bacterium]
MGQDTEELKRGIESTRSDMSDTLDAIGDRVMPARIAQRNKNKVVQTVGSVRDRVMGAAGSLRDNVADTVSEAKDAVQSAPGSAAGQTRGAPMVAGAIAFGIGFLVAAAFPPSQKEKELSGELMRAVEPAKEQLLDSAHEVADHLKQPALDAAQTVKAAATDGMHEVADTAKSAADSTRDQAKESIETVKNSTPTS